MKKTRANAAATMEKLKRRRAKLEAKARQKEDKETRRQGDKATKKSLPVSLSPGLPVSLSSPSSPLLPHPFAELLPLMSESEYAALKADIDANGQRDVIVLHEGKILDGRNRYKAMMELNRGPRTTDYHYSDAEALKYVYSKAVHRNMSDSQKAAAAVNFLPHFEKDAISRQKLNGVEPVPPHDKQKLVSGKTRAQMRAKLNQTGRTVLDRMYKLHVGWLTGDIGTLITGDMVEVILDRMYGPEIPAAKGKSRDFAGGLFGVSGRYVSDARMVFERDPKLFREVFEGRLPLTRAKRQLHGATREKHLEAKAKLAPTTGAAEIVDWDCLKYMETVAAKTYRLIFADPPYNQGIDYGKGSKADLLPPEKFLEWTGAWMAEARRILTSDGSLWVLISDEWAAEFALLLKRADFRIRSWVKWYETFGVNCSNNFNRTSRHLFYCVKGLPFVGASQLNQSAAGNEARDKGTGIVFNAAAFNRPSDRQTKYNDPRAAAGGKLWDDVWQIPRLVENSKERLTGFPTQLPLALVEPIVLGCSEPGDHVFDPFTGSGTTAVASICNGRKFTGTEINTKYAELARLRVRAAIGEGKS